jgi:hypothetical protein
MSAMRSVHPAETKEVASLPARYLTQMVIGAAGILMFTPFVILF